MKERRRVAEGNVRSAHNRYVPDESRVYCTWLGRHGLAFAASNLNKRPRRLQAQGD